VNAARLAVAVVLAGALAACARPASSAKAFGSSTPVAAVGEDPASSSDGARVYITNCSSCHQLDGRGVPGAFPPLAGNPTATGDPARAIAIVKGGSRGKIRVRGRSYDGVMPAWQGLISDEDIAAVVTYIRGAWNNGAPPVSAAGVKAIRP